MKSVSEKFKHTRDQYNIRMIFKTKHSYFTHESQVGKRSATDGTVHL
jgi:hypothetical protein